MASLLGLQMPGRPVCCTLEMSLLLQHGLVVTSAGSSLGDVLVEGERIAAVGSGVTAPGARVVDCTGKYILPGCIDPHTHLALPSMGTVSADDWTTGTVAAACGGTTTIIDFATQRGGGTLREAVERRRAEAEGRAVVDYGLHAGITDARPEVIGEVEQAIRDCGVPSFKIFLAYDFRVDDYAMIRVLEESCAHGGLVLVHAESFDIIRRSTERLAAAGSMPPACHAKAHPVVAEEQAIDRCVAAVELTGGRIYVVHLSSGRGLERVRQARRRGLAVLAETCPQYLTLAEDRYDEPAWGGAKYVMSPPLRPADNLEALWLGLRDGVVETVGTDHCPFNFRGQKDMHGTGDCRRIPNGIPGIETMLMLLHSEGVRRGRLSLERMVEVLSTGAARVFGLDGKGAIVAGRDADIVVFDPQRRFTITRGKLHQNVDYTPWEGWEVTGTPEAVYSRGRLVAQWSGDMMGFTGSAGAGRFLRRRPLATP